MTTHDRIFLAHASEDKDLVRDIYSKLLARGFKPWLDEKDLVPGQNWAEEIPKTIRESGIFLACLSQQSVEKQGYVQHELRSALVVYGEKPPGSIYLIPVKLNECEVPDLQLPELGIRLRHIQWLDYWKDDGFDRLVEAINQAIKHADPSQAWQPACSAAREQRLQQEINYRLAVLPMLLEEVFTFTQLHTVKGAVHGKAEEHPQLGKLGEFEALFPEFLGVGLFALIWELQQASPVHERPGLEPALKSARDLPAVFNRLVLLVPVGKEDSKWKMDRKYVQGYQKILDGFASGPWNKNEDGIVSPIS